MNVKLLYAVVLLGVGGIAHTLIQTIPPQFSASPAAAVAATSTSNVQHSVPDTQLVTTSSNENEATTENGAGPNDDPADHAQPDMDEESSDPVAAALEDISVIEVERSPDASVSTDSTVFTVPFYSQFNDITPTEWRKIGCGIASIAMLIDFYEPAVSVDKLLQQGIQSGAYIQNAGWSHQGLINLAKRHGLTGKADSYAHLSMDAAFARLENVVEEGPVMVSVHYTFDPRNPIPHLVVINGVHDGKVYYNDPAEASGGGSVSIEQFQSAWKKRHIEIRPVS